MKLTRALLVGAAVGLLVAGPLALSACSDPAARHHVVRGKHKVHKMSDGRYAFQGDNGVWYWYIYSSNNSARLDDGSLAMPGAWSAGGAPDPVDLAAGFDIDIDIPTLDGGAPISESQAASIESGTSEASSEAGGGMSDTSSGPSDSSPSVDSSVDSGGGDSGGGGGDGGGGGGDGG